MKTFVLLLGSLYSIVCCTRVKKYSIAANPVNDVSIAHSNNKPDTLQKVIHVYVALCDNKYQGIVPVPAKIGNGQDPDNNLYWGCAFGIRSYFKQSKNWKLLKKYPIDSMNLERLVFNHTSSVNLAIPAHRVKAVSSSDFYWSYVRRPLGFAA